MESESLTSGTLAGTGSFRCEQCGHVVTLTTADTLASCPSCGGQAFSRASLMDTPTRQRMTKTKSEAEQRAWMAAARELLETPGEYLAYEDGAQTEIVPLTREWTRVGRSLAANVRFDDPTVSRRHALIVRQPDGVRILDDRSLNGVFVNGDRVEWSVLQDGDEIVVGRYRLHFLVAAPSAARSAEAALGRSG